MSTITTPIKQAASPKERTSAKKENDRNKKNSGRLFYPAHLRPYPTGKPFSGGRTVNTDNISFSQAVDGYFLYAQSRHLSTHTLDDYANTFKKFNRYLKIDPGIASITPHRVEDFLRSQEEVSNKTLLNYTIGLSALWHWALKEHLVGENILQQVEKPKPEKKAIVPFSEADLKAMLNCLSQCKTYSGYGRSDLKHALPNTLRDRAIILLLVDTGMRASELCTAHIRSLDLRNNRIVVFGKGAKQRMVPFSARTGQAIWKYLATRKEDKPDDLLFTTIKGDPMERCRLLHLLINIGSRAGVTDAHPHRFRHTFAINYLRNGGDPFTLQDILGHSTMKMVRIYLRLAQSDLDDTHRRASPVDHWKL